MIKYSHGKGIVIYQKFKGKVAMLAAGTPTFLLINLQREDDKADFCLKVSTKIPSKSTNDDGIIHLPNPRCAKIEILERPTIVNISKNSTWTSTEGDDLIITCHTTGIPTPNVTWTRSGKKAKNFGPSSSLTLKNITREEDGLYWCMADNGLSTATASVRVIVKFPPSIEYITNDTNVNETDDVTLFCNSTGNPVPKITWVFGLDGRIIGTQETLTLSHVKRNQSGTYWCSAANGVKRPRNDSVRVTINYPPSIDTKPISQAVNESDNLRLFCNATGHPTPQITWFKKTDSLVPLTVGTALNVTNMSRTDSGVYKCRASNGIGTDAFASANVTVNSKPIETRFKSNVTRDTTIRGLSVTFLCNSNSVPPPALELRFKNTSLGLFSGGMFTIERVNASDEGMYQCVPHNVLGTGQIATLYLTVAVPPSFEYTSNDTTVKENDDIVLFCNSTGHPPPNITWTFLSGSEARIVGHEQYLTLSNVSRTQAGTYQCTASNTATTSKTTTIQVTVNYKPEIKYTVHTTIYTWINHQTKVTCAVDGVPSPNITFTQAGKVLHSTLPENGTSELLLKPKSTADFGDYTCTAKNHLGSVKKIIKIKHLVVPAAPEGLEIDTRLHSIEIHWKALDSTPDSPVIDYLVIVAMRGEPESQKNCTRVHTGQRQLMCAVNDLESGTVYNVRVAARNRVGYGEFTEKEVQTGVEAKPTTNLNTAKKEFQEQYQEEQLSNAVVDGIIAGVLFFCSLVVVIFAIVKYRRPCHLVCKKTSQDLSSEECNMGHDNPGLSAENPGAVEIDEQV
ncbi:Hemicentin-2 [Stylophora pistillata]|uniref:Hemicentin-2 n=2 Tax=Stylophora pistillata TaxID=50429 RepID=A0A2B4RIX7_STYPI|nr:Hemicentin-2 [Stylophora pistillata]